MAGGLLSDLGLPASSAAHAESGCSVADTRPLSTGDIKLEGDEWQRNNYDLLREPICTKNLVFAEPLPYCPVSTFFDSRLEDPPLPRDTSETKI